MVRFFNQSEFYLLFKFYILSKPFNFTGTKTDDLRVILLETNTGKLPTTKNFTTKLRELAEYRIDF